MPTNPKVVATLVPASTIAQNSDQKILVVAQQTPAATATVDTLTESIGVNGEQVGLFGRRSAAAKIVTAVKKSNPVSQIDVIGVGDGTTPRVVTATFTGTASEAMPLNWVHGSKKNHTTSISVAVGDNAAAIAATLDAAIDLDLDSPFTVTSSSGSVVHTAASSGIAPNAYPIGFVGSLPAGITVVIVETTPGAVDPDTSSTLDVVGLRRYQQIVWALDVVEGTADDVVTFLDDRFNSTNGRVEDGGVFYTNFNTLANVLSRNNAFNSENAWPICYNKITNAAKYFGPHLMEHPDEVNGYLAGIVALRLTDGEAISQFITATQGNEQFGGPKGASLPLFNTPMKGIASLAEPGREFDPLEVAQINDSGGSVIGNNSAETEVITGALLTTYKTLPSGVADETWKFINYRLTGSGVREFYPTNLSSRFAQSRLTDGDLVEGVSMANEDSIRAFCTRLFSTLTGATYILTRKGEENLKFFKENLDVSLNLQTGVVTITALFPIVTQVRQINMALKIAFNTGGA